MVELRAQLSLEFLISLAAFFAFLTVLVSVAKGGFETSVSASQNALVKQNLSEACFFIGFFSLDGKHAFVEKSFQGFSSEGKELRLQNFSRECGFEFRFEGDGMLKVESQGMEVR